MTAENTALLCGERVMLRIGHGGARNKAELQNIKPPDLTASG